MDEAQQTPPSETPRYSYGQRTAGSGQGVISSLSLECGGLAPLWSRTVTFEAKAAPGRRTPRRCRCPKNTSASPLAITNQFVQSLLTGNIASGVVSDSFGFP